MSQENRPEIEALVERLRSAAHRAYWAVIKADDALAAASALEEAMARPINPLPIAATAGHWITLQVERALYVDEGRELVLCDRLPSPVTLMLKLAEPFPKPTGGIAADNSSVAYVEHVCKKRVMRLSVPGTINGVQVVAVGFEDGSSLSVEAPDIAEAWAELRRAAESLNPQPIVVSISESEL